MNKRTFVFEHVVMIRPAFFVLLAFMITVLVLGLEFILEPYFNMYIGIWVTIILAIMLAVFKTFSKTVTVSFTDTDICFDINGAKQTYVKSALNGFYSFNYLHTNNCNLVMDFHFNNGKVIYLYNYQFNAGKFNADKHQLLEDFLKAAQHELNFEPVKKDRVRTITNTANVWFAKAATV